MHFLDNDSLTKFVRNTLNPLFFNDFSVRSTSSKFSPYTKGKRRYETLEKSIFRTLPWTGLITCFILTSMSVVHSISLSPKSRKMRLRLVFYGALKNRIFRRLAWTAFDTCPYDDCDALKFQPCTTQRILSEMSKWQFLENVENEYSGL